MGYIWQATLLGERSFYNIQDKALQFYKPIKARILKGLI